MAPPEEPPLHRTAVAACGIALALVAAAPARADLPLEEIGRVETLPAPGRPHWVFVGDLLLQRSALLDLDAGEFLGLVSTGFLSPVATFPRARPEFYLPETYYSRGSRGERTDVVTFYDAQTLAPVDEVVLPPKRAINVLAQANAALTDDDRFLAVFNMTPATSLSIVDVESRRFAGEIATPGCSLVYAAGNRRFLMLCSDGAFLTVVIDDAGQEISKTRSPPFFDPETDPVMEKATRHGDQWLFVSFEGRVHPVDVGGAEPKALEPWPLVGEADRADRWKVGGVQPFDVHQPTGRLFALAHQGGPDTHKDPGTELWVFDLASRERTQRLELHNPGISILSETIAPSEGWLGDLWNWMLDHVIPNPGVHGVQVTQDDAPLLVTGARLGGMVAVYDATSFELLRRVSSGNLTVHSLQAPFGSGR